MAYRYGNRQQMELLPQSIEEYVAKDDPVRAYDAFIDALDFFTVGSNFMIKHLVDLIDLFLLKYLRNSWHLTLINSFDVIFRSQNNRRN